MHPVLQDARCLMVNRNPGTRTRSTLVALIAVLAAACAVESSAPTDIARSSSGGETTATTDQAMMSIGFCQADCPGEEGDIEHEACLQGCMGEGGGGDEGAGGGGGHNPSCQYTCSRCAADPSQGPGLWRTCRTTNCEVNTIKCGRGSPVLGGKRPSRGINP
jgi:hypothetical protein